MRTTLAALALVTLTACGVTTPASPTLPPVPNVKITTGSGASLVGTVPSGAATGSTISITNANGTVSGITIKVSDGSTFGYGQKAPGNGSFEAIVFTDDGKQNAGDIDLISASLIATSSASAAQFGQNASYGRAANSILPSSGSATYTGDYRGTIGKDNASYMGHPDGEIVAITGTTTLNAVFGSGAKISGTISDRKSRLADGTLAPMPLTSIALDESSINSNGQYNSTITASGVTGGYEGLIGGPNGSGVAGAVRVDHTGGFTELGVFTGIIN